MTRKQRLLNTLFEIEQQLDKLVEELEGLRLNAALFYPIESIHTALLFRRISDGHFLQRQRKVTTCALVQSASGANVVLPVPLVMSSFAAHRTASV